MRKPKILECEVINPPSNPEEQEEYDRKICKALATAMVRGLDSKKVDSIVEALKKNQTRKVDKR